MRVWAIDRLTGLVRVNVYVQSNCSGVLNSYKERIFNGKSIMCGCPAAGNAGILFLPFWSKVGDVHLLYAIIKSDRGGLCIPSNCFRRVDMDYCSPLHEYLHAGHDILSYDICSDPYGW